MEKVNVYVDGFNLYFGLMEAGFEEFRWLNVKALAQNLLKPGQVLHEVKYFTARVANNPDKQKRQTTYLEALYESGVKIYYGQYQMNSIECRRCGNIWPDANEKMTDVNIATNLLVDAYKDSYDMAMLISGDSDLVPPIKAVHEIFPNKRVFVAFPPKRHNSTVALVAKGSLTVGRKKLAESQLPDVIQKAADGFLLKRPSEWK
ncbi:NYN domain-containing protein [Lacibacter sp. MH-610]|uniref:NYN domain-containing protein n=1 Tax=Lacibacter sp. MH-610 TaxID=3020883 RepID=UPI0038920593